MDIRAFGTFIRSRRDALHPEYVGLRKDSPGSGPRTD